MPKGHSGVFCCIPQDHGIESILDRTLIEAAEPLFERGDAVSVELPIQNTDRTTGGMLSHEIVKRIGAYKLEEGSFHATFRGSAGQSFGAWLAQGVTLELEGDANDYVGKGLSGGRLVVYPPAGSRPSERTRTLSSGTSRFTAPPVEVPSFAGWPPSVFALETPVPTS